ncbi:hypothetical protein ACJMK2_039653 [Sinanodonta woodiana]|uniref:Uncharacterized protein n=1 Tax=Sinanodonta woodiana TaxID=1069815 RepID=A0ABD3WCP2_SINWO
MSESRINDVKSSFNSSDQTMYVRTQKEDCEWMVSGPFEFCVEETIPNVSFNSNIDVQEEEINTFSHLTQNTLEGMCENVMDGIEDVENSRTDKLLKYHGYIYISSKQESCKGLNVQIINGLAVIMRIIMKILWWTCPMKRDRKDRTRQ